MKTILKIEIALLILVLLAAGIMLAISTNFLDLFRDPVLEVPETVPIATDPEPSQTAPPPPANDETKAPIPELHAQQYFAYDLRRQEYLAQSGDVDARVYPASITKLLTCYVLLQYLQPQDSVTVGDALDLIPYDSSVAGLKKQDVLTAEQLVSAMLLPSGNDAALVAAAAAGLVIAQNSSLADSTAIQVFVKEMNRVAQELGMENSHFSNPDGFHASSHYTTMDDLVALCKAVLAEPLILKYTSMTRDTISLPDRELTFQNTNPLLHPHTPLYRANAIGLKTGYTSKAGNCLLTAFFEEDRVILVGVFGCPEKTMDRYFDTLMLYDSVN